MKILTKEVNWKETKNPYVDALMCPFCEDSGIVLEPAVVLADNPIQHVNLGTVRGKLLTLKGKCSKCGNGFLWRMMFMPQGSYSWLDVAVSAKTFNELLAAHSNEQLPCMCENCVQEGKVKMAYDETNPPPKPPPIQTTCPSKMMYPPKAGAPPKMPKAVTPTKPVMEVKMPDDLNEALKQIVSPGSAAAGLLASADIKARQLTDEQVAQIAGAMKMDFNAIATKNNMTLEEAVGSFTTLIESYVRIKFATFQPKPSTNPNVPPNFPAIVPTRVFETFQAQNDFVHFCQFIVSKFYLVDNTLDRHDLAASLIWNHMCCMCPVKTCGYHPDNRKEQ